MCVDITAVASDRSLCFGGNSFVIADCVASTKSRGQVGLNATFIGLHSLIDYLAFELLTNFRRWNRSADLYDHPPWTI